MNRSGRFLFMGFLVPDLQTERLFAGEKQPQFSAVHFQRRLVGALARAGVSIDAVTTPPIAAFPRSRHWWVNGVDYELTGTGVRGRQIAGPNLPAVRLVVRLVQFLRHGLSALQRPCEGILVYSVHTPLVAASLLLKRLHRIPVFVFIPDLPTFMGGPTNPLKRFLKRLDGVLVRHMLAGADGAFPITERIGRDWLVRGPRYWPMEGVSDEAAGVLARARATGAYVFRGAPRPRLLFTGTLENVMTFADAFHRSPIDASVTFMGGGEDFADLQKLSASDDRIQLKPFATGADFAREIDGADFLLNPRDPAWPGAAYSFPSKLFDYFRAGKPIISTRLDGIPADYFTVLRPIDLRDQAAFQVSLQRALRADEDPDAIWTGAERLAARLSSASIGPELIARIREWTA